MAKKRTSEIFDLHGLARAFGLDIDLDKFMDDSLHYIDEEGGYAYRAARKEGASEGKAEKAREKAEKMVHDNLELAYIWTVYETIEKEAEDKFDLNVTQQNPNRYKVTPKTDWKTSLKKIIETINGIGMFHFSSVKEFLDSGPYTPREGVLTHLHYLADYGSVYGEASLKHQFESNLENKLRYL